ncbi:MAG: hypothetical protein KGL12_15930 [Rhodospirillales bacterium]|nr:hypothetical protein [Rhodospirillales bacterium]
MDRIVINPVKEKLARGDVVASMTVRLTRGIEIARIAATAGFDTIYVDMEHNTLDIGTTCQICIAAMEAGLGPMVRVAENNAALISRVLDGGAMGVIVPHIRGAADARAAVAAAKFAPEGARSAGGPLAHYQYRSLPGAAVAAAMNAATMVVAMMETTEALAHVEEIAAVPGIDMLLVGTSDLTAEMGIAGQFDDERVEEAYARTLAACRAVGKAVGVGGLAGRPDLMARYVKMGARYVSTGTDLGFLLAAAGEKVRMVRGMGT